MIYVHYYANDISATPTMCKRSDSFFMINLIEVTKNLQKIFSTLHSNDDNCPADMLIFTEQRG